MAIPSLQRPAALFIDISDEDTSNLRAEIEDLGGSVHVISNGDSVRFADYDLIVTAEEGVHLQHSVPTLCFGASWLLSGYLENAARQVATTWTAENRTISKTITIAEEWSGDVRRLIEASLFQEEPHHKEHIWFYDSDLVTSENGPSVLEYRPFAVSEGQDNPVRGICLWAQSGHIDSPRRGAPVWVLPATVTEKREWQHEFLTFVGTEHPESIFRRHRDWRATQSEWMSSALQARKAELMSLECEKESLLNEIDLRIEEARASFDTQTIKEETGVRRLLTADGDELENAVMQAFEQLGFTVEAMDDHHVHTNGAKLEDLRVHYGDWTALVEVKGYTKGAKVRDLSQITSRPAVAYLKETQREADALWHVVNHHRHDSPSSRGNAINDTSALDVLESNGGCLIDTRDLFQALNATLDRERIRRQLMDTKGQWEFGE